MPSSAGALESISRLYCAEGGSDGETIGDICSHYPHRKTPRMIERLVQGANGLYAGSMPFDALVERFRESHVEAIVLMGSYARGDAGRYSDVDLVRFLVPTWRGPTDSQTFVIGDQLVVVSNVMPQSVEEWFTEPERATWAIAGLLTAQALWDPNGVFATVQSRARAFRWDTDMQAKANSYAGREMVGWAEEAHKGLEGLRRDDIGRLLNARFGLTFGLANVARVYLGVFITGENTFYAEICEKAGPDSRLARLLRAAFGIESTTASALTLRDHVTAGLRLYVETARLVRGDVDASCGAIIDHTVAEIVRSDAMRPRGED